LINYGYTGFILGLRRQVHEYSLDIFFLNVRSQDKSRCPEVSVNSNFTLPQYIIHAAMEQALMLPYGHILSTTLHAPGARPRLTFNVPSRSGRPPTNRSESYFNCFWRYSCLRDRCGVYIFFFYITLGIDWKAIMSHHRHWCPTPSWVNNNNNKNELWTRDQGTQRKTIQDAWYFLCPRGSYNYC